MNQQHHSEPGWSNPKVLLIFGLIFLCGMTFGSAATSAYLHRHMPAVKGGTPPIESMRQVGLQGLKEALKLTVDQERAVKEELDEYSKYYENIEEQRQDVAEHGEARIMRVLTPEQKQKFEGMLGQAAARR